MPKTDREGPMDARPLSGRELPGRKRSKAVLVPRVLCASGHRDLAQEEAGEDSSLFTTAAYVGEEEMLP